MECSIPNVCVRAFYDPPLSINATIISLGYVLWFIHQYESNGPYERRVFLNFLLGDSTTMFFYNAEKFLIMPIFLCIYFCDIAYKAVCNLSVALLSASTTFNEDIETTKDTTEVMTRKLDPLLNALSSGYHTCMIFKLRVLG
ncbi:hypothetical protein HUJ04_008120 [Dendroctonus ponderosae]|nr:hypothetical protein HUJ04_008120 [Dendroctonus ponderosae]